MTDHSEAPEEPNNDSDASIGVKETHLAKGRQSFSKIKRELTDEDFKTAAVQKLLVDEIEKLEDERIQLIGFKEKYFETDKQKSVLEEKLKFSISSDIIASACFVIGGALISLSIKIIDSDFAIGLALILLSLGLIAAGIVAKTVRS